jgi:hypothetical protein
MIKNYEYQSDFARKYYGQGRQEGRQEGSRDAVIRIARARFGELTDADLARVAAITELAVLERLLVVAATESYEAFLGVLPPTT